MGKICLLKLVENLLLGEADPLVGGVDLLVEAVGPQEVEVPFHLQDQ